MLSVADRSFGCKLVKSHADGMNIDRITHLPWAQLPVEARFCFTLFFGGVFGPEEFDQKSSRIGLHFSGLNFYSVDGKTSGTSKARPFFGTKITATVGISATSGWLFCFSSASGVLRRVCRGTRPVCSHWLRCSGLQASSQAFGGGVRHV